MDKNSKLYAINLGQNLLRIRKTLGETQVEFYKNHIKEKHEYGMRRTTEESMKNFMSDIERGNKTVSYDLLFMYSELANVPIEDLFKGDTNIQSFTKYFYECTTFADFLVHFLSLNKAGLILDKEIPLLLTKFKDQLEYYNYIYKRLPDELLPYLDNLKAKAKIYSLVLSEYDDQKHGSHKKSNILEESDPFEHWYKYIIDRGKNYDLNCHPINKLADFPMIDKRMKKLEFDDSYYYKKLCDFRTKNGIPTLQMYLLSRYDEGILD